MQGTRTQCRGNGCGASPPPAAATAAPAATSLVGKAVAREMPAAEVLAVQKQVEGMDAAGVASWLAVRGYSPADAKVLSLCVHVHDEMCVYIYTAVYIHMHVGYILDSKP